MSDIRETMKSGLKTLLNKNVSAVAIARDDGVPFVFVSNDVLITQQTVQPLSAVNNISKYIHSELTGDQGLQTIPEKAYVYISGDKHDYLIYPITHSIFMILFVNNMNEQTLNSLLMKIAKTVQEFKEILR